MKHTNHLLKGAVFIAIGILILLLVNALYVSNILSQKTINRMDGQYEEAGDVRVMFFGDSHVANAVNPAAFEDAFNYAQPSETYEQTYYKVRRVLEERNVEVYVLTIDAHTFSDYRINPYYHAWYWSRLMTNEELLTASEMGYAQIFLRKHLPVIGNGEEFDVVVRGTEMTELENGWRKRYDDFSTMDVEEIAKIRAGVHYAEEPHEISEELLTSFVNTLDLLEEKTVIVVKYPLTDAYLNAVEERGVDIEAMYEEIGVVLEERDIEVLDYEDLYLEDYELYSNSDHLNVKGATEFSELLASDIKEIIG